MVTLALILLVTVSTNTLIGARIVENDYRSYDGLKCDKQSEWLLVNLKNLGVNPHRNNSTNAFRASLHSCAVIPVHLKSNDSVELFVYIKGVSNKNGVLVTVFNDDNVPKISYMYDTSSQDYDSEWKRISLPIDNDLDGYVALLGYSQKDDLVLLLSFPYTLGNFKLHQNINKKDTKPHTLIRRQLGTEPKGEFEKGAGEDIESVFNNELESQVETNIGDEILIDNIVDANNYLDNIKGLTTDDLETSQDVESPEETDTGTDDPPLVVINISSWNPFKIALVVVVPLTVIALVSFGCYHLGMMKGRKTVPAQNVESVEVPTVIPRVTSVYADTTSDRLRAALGNED